MVLSLLSPRVVLLGIDTSSAACSLCVLIAASASSERILCLLSTNAAAPSRNAGPAVSVLELAEDRQPTERRGR